MFDRRAHGVREDVRGVRRGRSADRGAQGHVAQAVRGSSMSVRSTAWSRISSQDRCPDVLTLYISRHRSLRAHRQGRARRGEPGVLDRGRRSGARALVAAHARARDARSNRWVIVTVDHGHTAVIADAAHSIDTGEDDAPGVLHALGWKTRPFRANVDAHDPFDAVLAYGGAMAFVYLADRSRCTGERRARGMRRRAIARMSWRSPMRSTATTRPASSPPGCAVRST